MSQNHIDFLLGKSDQTEVLGEGVGEILAGAALIAIGAGIGYLAIKSEQEFQNNIARLRRVANSALDIKNLPQQACVGLRDSMNAAIDSLLHARVVSRKSSSLQWSSDMNDRHQQNATGMSTNSYELRELNRETGAMWRSINDTVVNLESTITAALKA